MDRVFHVMSLVRCLILRLARESLVSICTHYIELTTTFDLQDQHISNLFSLKGRIGLDEIRNPTLITMPRKVAT